MRVLHVISSIDLRSGGPTTALLGLVEAQSRIGMEVSVAATYTAAESTDSAERMRQAGAVVTLIGPAQGKLVRHPELHKTIDLLVGESHIIHIHALWEEIQHQAATRARQRRLPYVIRPCGMLDPWSLSQNALMKRLYMLWRLRSNLNRAAAIHFTSELERDLTKRLKLKSPPIVEPNGLDLSEFRDLPPRGTFRMRYPQIQFHPMVLFLSRLHPKKGLELLIPAFAQAARNDAVLVIAGPDAHGYQSRIEQLAADHGIRERTIFTGMLEGPDRVAAYRDADLFVLPSYQENFGIVAAEAMAAGTAVIVSDQVNIHPQISKSQAGGVVPMDIALLAHEMRKWLSDPEARKLAGERGRALACERYDWEKIATRWAGHYRKLTMK